jgi:hypothetical protein
MIPFVVVFMSGDEITSLFCGEFHKMKSKFARCWGLSVWIAIQLLLASVSDGQTGAYDPARLYPADSLKADLSFLRDKLEQMHPALYRYASKAELGGLFDSLERVVAGPMDEQQFLSLLELVPARIRNGHTMILPSAAAMEYYGVRGRSLPFLVGSFRGRLYILENNSADTSIVVGSEVLSINGLSAAEVRRKLIARTVRDGFNETYPEWILDRYFSSYYRICFGEPDEFLLELRGSAGQVFQKRIRALARDSVSYYRRLRYGQDHPQAEAGLGVVARLIENGRVSVLKVSSFDPDVLRSKYNQDYRRAIDSVYVWLEGKQVKQLVLDLRDNQGGDFPPARYLLAHLMSTPTQFLYGGSQARMIRPALHRFAGRLVVLINGGSFSSTAMVAAILEREKRAVFVGEETGGNKYVISGDPEEVLLPHTQISCLISTVIYRITQGVNDGHGVMPDYQVVPLVGDRLTHRDRALETAVEIISRGQKEIARKPS